MQKNIFEQLKQGHEYITLWPTKPELLHYFSEYRAVIASRFVLRYGAPLAALAFILPVGFIGMEQIRHALVYSIFIGSLPVQALFLMYKQSKQQLPPTLKTWYRNGVEKLKEQVSDNEFVVNKPTYFDLAKLLNVSYNAR